MAAKPFRRGRLSPREQREASYRAAQFLAAGAGKEVPEWWKPPPPKRQYTKRTDGSSEHQEQVAVIDWWDAACQVYGVPRFALFAVPNGAHLASGYIGASRLKAEGMRPGMFDLVLAVPRDQFHGMYIEMKYGHNKPSDEQLAVKEYLARAGYHVGVHWSADSAIAAIKEYLK